MKVRRSNRLVDMTRYLMEHPRTLGASVVWKPCLVPVAGPV